ncbi:signal peptidase I [Candidatus Nomurabacteria bacterium]|nr:signal peptidase I [Candidatus Nomurabacteria bacterium]MCB9819435.1 signal peptidase I [Candidatus Nomurabacteria bacterium]
MSYDNNHQEVTRTQADLPEVKNDSTENSFWEIARFAIIALIIVLPVRWFIAQPFIVSGASMQDTFHDKEYLIVDQLSYRFEEPARGDVIIFRYPNDPSKYFIKRIIALPYETINISGTSVQIQNDAHPEGFTLDEPYALLGESNRPQSITLGSGEYFVMGDNRDHSSDSRTWGTLDRDAIVGRAFIRLLPPQRIDFMPGENKVNE